MKPTLPKAAAHVQLGWPASGPARRSATCRIGINHARLASIDLGRHAHFGGLFLFGVRVNTPRDQPISVFRARCTQVEPWREVSA